MNPFENMRVMAAMSGGVDSSAAALLLVRGSADVCGATCKMYGSNVLGDSWEAQDDWLETVDAAKRVCRALGIEHFTFNMKAPFERCVIDEFVGGYLAGRTPNPCIACNKAIKFGELHRKRQALGCDALATGNFAGVGQRDDGRWELLRARHVGKDQSYFLYNMTQDQLAHTLFPLGDMSKDEVRKLAAEAGFENAEATESQDICFVSDGDYVGFIERWIERRGGACPAAQNESATGLAEGDIVDKDGRVVGRHGGIARYTVGQRKGLGISAGEALYVIGKNVDANELVVGPRDELMTSCAVARDVSYVSVSENEAARAGEMRVTAKTTYRAEPKPATASFENGTLRVRTNDPIMMPAPGQALVVYDEAAEKVLAGGTVI